MFPHPDLGDLRSNGPIVNMPNWQALSSPLPVPPDHKSTPAEHGRVAEDSPWQGESKTACAGTPSPSPLPKGDCSEAASADDPQSLSSLLPLPPGEGRGEGALNFEPRHHPKAGPPYPALGGRPKALDDDKQSTVCNLVAAGVSLRQAARYVDCDPNSIRREARRNGEFRRQLAKARSEASIHPLSTLRQAAKTNWRAALCWMERLDPERFARPDSSIITKRESNQFVADLVESIERAVSDAGERSNLYELLSAAMPAAMRRHWDGHGSRRNLKQAMRDFDKKKYDELERRAKRRREFTARIASYLPWQLIRELSDYHDVLTHK